MRLPVGIQIAGDTIVSAVVTSVAVETPLAQDPDHATLSVLYFPASPIHGQELGSLLSDLKRTAETHLGSALSDCVIGVPPYFTDPERDRTLRAAEMAGLSPLELLDGPAAAVLGITLQQALTGGVVLLDIGRRETQAVAAHFGDGGAAVLGAAHERDLGAADFDEALLQNLLRYVVRDRPAPDGFVRRLRASCERARRELSSQAVARVELEWECDEDGEVQMCEVVEVTGEMFRAISEGLLERIAATCARAVEDAGLGVERVQRVELVGLATTIPAIAENLEGRFGWKAGRALDARAGALDESVCVARGCAIRCAVLSPESGYYHQDDSSLHGKLRMKRKFELTPRSFNSYGYGPDENIGLLEAASWNSTLQQCSSVPPLLVEGNKAKRSRGIHGFFNPVAGTSSTGVKAAEAVMKWKELPLDVLIIIAQKMASSPGDVVRFGIVCKSFNLAANTIFSSSLLSSSSPPPPSSLCLPSSSSVVVPITISPRQQHRWRNGPALARIYPVQGIWQPILPPARWDQEGNGDGDDDGAMLTYQLPALTYRLPSRNCLCIGSSRGLLAFYDRELRFFLFEAQTGLEIPLPALSFPNILEATKSKTGSISYAIKRKSTADFHGTYPYSPRRLVLTPRSAQHPAALCALEHGGGKTMFYCFLERGRWTRLRIPTYRFTCSSHAYHKGLGRFYLFDRLSSRLMTCDLGGPARLPSFATVPVEDESLQVVKMLNRATKIVSEHLVECGGELLLVVENASLQWWRKAAQQSPVFFRVFRLELGTESGAAGRARWVEVSEIGPHALFLGRNDPFSLSTRDFPGFRGNHVYLHAPLGLVSECLPNTRQSQYGYLSYRIDGQPSEGPDRVSCNWLPAYVLQSFWLDPRVGT